MVGVQAGIPKTNAQDHVVDMWDIGCDVSRFFQHTEARNCSLDGGVKLTSFIC